MRKGSIVLVPFPFTDLSGKKIRPALVLATGKGEDCILAFISSVQTKKGLFDIPVAASGVNGLKADSIIRADKLATLQKKIILGQIGKLEPAILATVDKKLKNLLRV